MEFPAQGKELPVHVIYEVLWGPESSWTWGEEKDSNAPNSVSNNDKLSKWCIIHYNKTWSPASCRLALTLIGEYFSSVMICLICSLGGPCYGFRDQISWLGLYRFPLNSPVQCWNNKSIKANASLFLKSLHFVFNFLMECDNDTKLSCREMVVYTLRDATYVNTRFLQ